MMWAEVYNDQKEKLDPYNPDHWKDFRLPCAYQVMAGLANYNKMQVLKKSAGKSKRQIKEVL